MLNKVKVKKQSKDANLDPFYFLILYFETFFKLTMWPRMTLNF